MKKPDLRRMPAERISHTVLYALVAVAAVVFALFRFVGYDTPYYDNPELNAPLLTDLLVAFMILLTAAAVVTALWAAWRGFGKNRYAGRVVNGIHTTRLAAVVAASTALLLAATFALAPTHSIVVNGDAYADTFWLRTAGMFIDTSLLMIAAAVGAVLFGSTRSLGKDRKDKR